MKIVIDIPEEIYAECKGDVYFPDTGGKLFDAVRNGTLLPKEHGDLIDRIEVIKSLFDYYKGNKTIGQCIEDVQTIIEESDSE